MADRRKVLKTMSAVLRKPEAKLRPDAVLQDLVEDSFVLVEMVIDVQEKHKVRFMQEDLNGVKTVEDFLRLAERAPKQ